jgi:hypothetical protein
MLLRVADRRSMMVAPSPKGPPWAYRNFARTWDATKADAGVAGLLRRDPRRMAMVRMAEAGATTSQIAAVSGHAIDQTLRILDTYMPRRGEVAAGAIDAWEAAQIRSVVVPIRNVQQPMRNDVQPRKSRKVATR